MCFKNEKLIHTCRFIETRAIKIDNPKSFNIYFAYINSYIILFCDIFIPPYYVYKLDITDKSNRERARML